MSGPLNNPGGAFGVTDLQSTVWSQSVPFKASAAVTAKRVVTIGTDGQVVIAATDSTATLCVGVAEAAIASGYIGNVIISGIAENVPCHGTVAAGDRLKRSATTAGSVIATTAPAAGEVIGVAIAASSSNTVDVWVCKSLATS